MQRVRHQYKVSDKTAHLFFPICFCCGSLSNFVLPHDCRKIQINGVVGTFGKQLLIVERRESFTLTSSPCETPRPTGSDEYLKSNSSSVRKVDGTWQREITPCSKNKFSCLRPQTENGECHDACFVADSTQEKQTLTNVSGLLSMFFGERSEASNMEQQSRK